MSTGTPSSSGRPRLMPTSRTARPIMGGGRPVRIDLTGGEPFGAATGADWGLGASDPEVSQSGSPLSDMADRAAAQTLALRKMLDEAAVADRAVRTHSVELAQRLMQGERFAAELDQRMVRAGKAAGVVEKAAAALAAMETAVQQVQAAQDAMVQGFERKLAEQQRTLERRLAEQEAAFESRIARQQEMFERRIGDWAGSFDAELQQAAAGATAARVEAERRITECGRALREQAEQACAGADRHVAQVQSRASLILDGVADRIDVLSQQCDRIGTNAQEHVDALCAKAASVLGHDPRSDYQSEPRPGSLAAAAARADALIQGVGEAALRIKAVRDDAAGVLEQLAAARAEAGRTTEDIGPRLDGLRATIQDATAQAARMQQTLDDALHGQAAAADKSAQASMLLSRQREDLLAIAEAGRYHVEQCRAAQQTLEATIQSASGQAGRLERGMAEIREQAESMVALARDAAALVTRARGSAEQSGAAANQC